MKKTMCIIIGLFFAIAARAQVCCTAGNEEACCAAKGKKWCADDGTCRKKCLSEMCPPGYEFDMQIMTCKKTVDLCAGISCTGCETCNATTGQCELPSDCVCIDGSCHTCEDGSVPYAESTYDDGTPKTGGCCQVEVTPIQMSATENVRNGGLVNACISNLELAACTSYDEEGRCLSYTSIGDACVPYVRSTYADGTPKTGDYCCELHIYELGTPDGGYVRGCGGDESCCTAYGEGGVCTQISQAYMECHPNK